MVICCSRHIILTNSPKINGKRRSRSHMNRLCLPTLLALLVLSVFSFPLKAASTPPPVNVKDTIFIYNSLKVHVYDDASGSGSQISGAVSRTPEPKAKKREKNENYEEYDLKPIFALRTNLLIPGFNVGLQIPIGNRISIGADWYYPFLRREWHEQLDQTNCFQALSPGIDVRFYLGRKHSKGRENWQYRLSGHSIGIYGMVGKYDVELDFHGEQAEFINTGIDYMYSARIGKRKRLRLDLSVGVGYFQSKAIEYQVFRPGGLAYKTGKTLEHTWIGPTKATISLVIPINAKVEKKEERK